MEPAGLRDVACLSGVLKSQTHLNDSNNQASNSDNRQILLEYNKDVSFYQIDLREILS